MTGPTTQPTTGPEKTGAERTPSKTHRVADTLRAEITAGVLPAGRFLPSEAEIQARFGVSRGTARNAVDLLNAWGLVATTHGKGSIVRRLSDGPAHAHAHAHARAPAPPHRHLRRRRGRWGGWRTLEEPGTYRTQASADVALTRPYPRARRCSSTTGSWPTPDWQARYALRAGVEGTIRQGVAVTGRRRARYRGLPKTRLEHVYSAVALNLIRLDAYWNGHPLDRTRTSHLARLELALAA